MPMKRTITIIALAISIMLCDAMLVGCESTQTESESPEAVSIAPFIHPTAALQPTQTPAPSPAIESQIPEISEPLTAEDYEAVFPDAQSIPMVLDSGHYRAGEDLVICDDDGTIYLSGRKDSSSQPYIYRWHKGESQRLCEGSGIMNVSGNYLYFYGLNRIPLTGGAHEHIASKYISDIGWYQLASQTIFTQIERSLGFHSLVAFALDAPDQLVTIWEDTDEIKLMQYKAGSDGVAFILYSGEYFNHSHVERLYYQSADGTITLLDEVYDVKHSCDDLQFYNGAIYYGICDSEITTIYCADVNTGEKTYCCSFPDRYANFYVYEEAIYISSSGEDGLTFFKTNLDGREMAILAVYENPALEIGRGIYMLPSKDYLYLEGQSVLGGKLVTRIPLFGDNREEEVFYEGSWLSLEQYTEAFSKIN